MILRPLPTFLFYPRNPHCPRSSHQKRKWRQEILITERGTWGPWALLPLRDPQSGGTPAWQVSGRAWEAGGAVGPKALGGLLAGCLLGSLAGSGQEGSETPAGNILHPPYLLAQASPRKWKRETDGPLRRRARRLCVRPALLLPRQRKGISILQRREVTFKNVANQSKVTQLGRGWASLSPRFWGKRALVGVGVRCTLFWGCGCA